jgi:hypothetical protein
LETTPVDVTIQKGAIGLGLDEQLADLRREGAATYDQWFEHKLTRVRPVEANLWAAKFARAFRDAVGAAPQIIFDLTGLEVSLALQNGVRGFVSKNYTSAELHLILNNPEWSKKTTFIDEGRIVRPVISDGLVTAFAP